MKKSFFLAVFVLLFGSLVSTAYGKSIELTDGSILDGEIVSFAEGKYTIQSPSLGTLHIEDSKVRSIHNVAQPVAVFSKEAVPLDPAAIQSEMQKLQPAITRNPDIMKTIAGLISNPDFQALLKDPEVMNAAKSLDLKTLMANQKFVNALNDPTVKEIDRKIEKQ